VNAVRQGFKSARGFTLLEIMVVMIIAGLMVALVPPLFSGAVSGTRLKGSARDLAVALRETRSQAIIRNSEQLVHLDLESPRYRIGNAKPRALPADVVMDVETITGERVDQMSQHVVRFYPDGSSSGELITLIGGNQAYHLQLNWLTGSITITEGMTDAG
jgi:general secretion pathway protein H